MDIGPRAARMPAQPAGEGLAIVVTVLIRQAILPTPLHPIAAAAVVVEEVRNRAGLGRAHRYIIRLRRFARLHR